MFWKFKKIFFAKNKILVSKSTRKNLVEEFINFLIVDLAKQYSLQLDKHKKNSVHDIVLNYLDPIIFHLNERLLLENGHNNLNKNIIKMSPTKKDKLEKAIEKSQEFQHLVTKLNFIYNIVKKEELQNKIFLLLYEEYIKKNVQKNLQLKKIDNQEEEYMFINENKIKFTTKIKNMMNDYLVNNFVYSL